jgi:tetratricopeptide (TPR) repeat protein
MQNQSRFEKGRESMKTRILTAPVAAVALASGLGLVTAGCGKYSFSNMKAMKAFKDANVAYQSQDWKKAVARYEEAIHANPDLNAGGVTPYFFLANSYDNLYKPARAGEAENDSYIQKAIENYKISAQKDSGQMRTRAMEYLVAAYGPEKLNDPSQAEPIVNQMIQMDPNEPANYFYLAKIYEDAGRYDDAEQTLLKAKGVKPNDPVVYTTLSGFYNRQGDFPKTMAALHQAADLEPNNPEGYHRLAVFYWEKAFRDHRLPKAEKVDYLQKGVDAENKALGLNPNYAEALTYKNILLRLQANETSDRKEQERLIKEADQLRNRAMELNKKKLSGVS